MGFFLMSFGRISRHNIHEEGRGEEKGGEEKKKRGKGKKKERK